MTNQPAWADELDKIQAQCDRWEEQWDAEDRAEALARIEAAEREYRAAKIGYARLTAGDGLESQTAAPATKSVESPYLNVTEAAVYLRSTPATTYDRVKRGKLVPVPGVKGRLLFTRESLDRFLTTRRRGR